MIPGLAKLLGDVHGNGFVRKGIEPRDEVSCHLYDTSVFCMELNLLTPVFIFPPTGIFFSYLRSW